jgi:hypothetical protein
MRAMPALTPQQMLDAYLAAELAVLAGKEARLNINGVERTLRHEDLDMIQAGRREWERKVSSAAAAAVPGRQTIGGLGFALANFSGPR